MAGLEQYNEWRLRSPGGIRHRVVDQYGSFGEEDADWTMVVIIRSQDLTAFLLEAFPLPVFGGSILYPRRFYPAGLPALHATRVSIKRHTDGRPIDPFGGDPHAPSGTYEEYLQLTIQFGPCPENSEPDPSNPFTFLEVSATASGEFLTAEVNGDSITWGTTGGGTESPDEQDTPLEQRVPSTEVEWTCRWKQVAHAWFHSTLLPRLRDMLGKVNSTTMTVAHDAPAETILFVSWSMQQQFTWRDGHAGASPVALDLKFIEKNFEAADGTQVTHNHLWRPNVGWRRLYINGNDMYEQGNLNTIFRP